MRPSVHSTLPSKLVYMETCSHVERKFAEGTCTPTFEITCVELHMICHFPWTSYTPTEMPRQYLRQFHKLLIIVEHYFLGTNKVFICYQI